MRVTIRPLAAADKAAWLPLWKGYVGFHQTSLADEITERTWQRLLDEGSSLFCRLAEADGDVVGFAVCVLHEGSWVTAPICYLEDLFVAETARGKGIARQLINTIMEEARREGCSRLYWHTARNNPARKLYDEFAPADEYVRYRMAL